MCEVIKIRLKRKDERRCGKENPLKKRWIKTYLYDVTHDTFQRFITFKIGILICLERPIYLKIGSPL